MSSPLELLDCIESKFNENLKQCHASNDRQFICVKINATWRKIQFTGIVGLVNFNYICRKVFSTFYGWFDRDLCTCSCQAHNWHLRRFSHSHLVGLCVKHTLVFTFILIKYYICGNCMCMKFSCEMVRYLYETFCFIFLLYDYYIPFFSSVFRL